jgi:hypothetical protein
MNFTKLCWLDAGLSALDGIPILPAGQRLVRVARVRRTARRSFRSARSLTGVISTEQSPRSATRAYRGADTEIRIHISLIQCRQADARRHVTLGQDRPRQRRPVCPGQRRGGIHRRAARRHRDEHGLHIGKRPPDLRPRSLVLKLPRPETELGNAACQLGIQFPEPLDRMVTYLAAEYPLRLRPARVIQAIPHCQPRGKRDQPGRQLHIPLP